uniref:Uncharacterized protein n=1 Tax=uncultured bacterium A1Q1_fos_1877 TaxID=1256555 RepID=L7VWC8_9BACT|nr:hypothetical protein [uncultured bacterium A1Q1_fos_1877]
MSTSLNVDLQAGKKKDLNLTVTIPTTGLTVEKRYYFVLKIVSPGIREGGKGDPQLNNNTIFTYIAFEFLGSHGPHFEPESYFYAIRQTLSGYDPFKHQGAPYPIDAAHYTAVFETPGGYDNPRTDAYLDKVGVATIGIGLNLNALFPEVKVALAASVRAYYAEHALGDLSGSSDDEIIQLLKTQATAHLDKEVISAPDAKLHFDVTYKKHAQMVKALVTNTVPSNVMTVLVDINFNSGLSSWPTLLSIVRAKIYNPARAGFALMDALRNKQIQPDRYVANYQFLVAGHLQEIGRIIKVGE